MGGTCSAQVVCLIRGLRLFGKNVPPAGSVTVERMRRHRGWVKMDF